MGSYKIPEVETGAGSLTSARILSSILLFTCGLFLLIATYYSSYARGFFENSLFWTGIVLMSGSVLLTLVDPHRSRTQKAIALWSWGLALYLPHILGSPDHFTFYDEPMHYRYAEEIYNSGKAIDVRLQVPFLAAFPGLELTTAALRFATGLPTFQAGTLLVAIIHSTLPVVLYLMFDVIGRSHYVGALAAFAYTGNSQYTLLDASFVYESMGLMFFALILLLVLNRLESRIGKRGGLSVAMIVLLCGIVVTHHLSSYVLILFLLVFAIVSTGAKYRHELYGVTSLAATIALSWLGYVAAILSLSYAAMLTITLAELQDIRYLSVTIEQFGSVFPFPIYEMIVRRFLYLPLLFVMFASGLVTWWRARPRYSPVVSGLSVFGLLFFATTATATFGPNLELGRLSPFLFVGTCFFVGLSVGKILYSNGYSGPRRSLQRAVICVALLLILIGGVGVGVRPPYRSPGSTSPQRYGLECMTVDVFAAADWLMKSAGRDNRVVADEVNALTQANYGVQYAMMDGAWNVFYPMSVDEGVRNYIAWNSIEYIIVDTRVTLLLPEKGYYFYRTEIRNSPYYGQVPLPAESVRKFDESPYFAKIFGNGNISIYKVRLLRNVT